MSAPRRTEIGATRYDGGRRKEIVMKRYAKSDFPTSEVRRFLEPGPIVLVSSAWKSRRNIMTMGWHMMAEFDRVACYISTGNYSYELVRGSGECVINVPEVGIAAKVVDIGNSSGADIDKFEAFGLTAEPAAKVDAPLIAECFASFECRLADDRLLRSSNLFIFEVVKAHVAKTPKYPRTIHYRGDGVFMISGENTARWRKRFRPGMV
jgi:flavin reductase (DIM6/NTAB) family NADH-FMN oxidoreductase RutF